MSLAQRPLGNPANLACLMALKLACLARACTCSARLLSACSAQKKKLFYMSCKKQAVLCYAKKQAVPYVMKPCKKDMQKPYKNHAKCGAYGANPPNPSLPGPCYILQGNPLNIYSSEFLAVLHMQDLTRQPTEHPLSPGFLLYVLVPRALEKHI